VHLAGLDGQVEPVKRERAAERLAQAAYLDAFVMFLFCASFRNL
jgi:hypothetical protein